MAPRRYDRDEELSTKPGFKKKLLDIFKDVDQGFTDQNTRADDILDYWDVYNCQLGERQFYNGNSQIFVPIVTNAIEARKTRFVNQMFPQSGRYVEVTSTDESMPYATMALAEHYVRQTKLRTEVMPALMVNGDVEGQYTLYVGWEERTRHVVSRETRGIEVGGLEHRALGEVEDIKTEEVSAAGPYVEVISDCDFIVLPVTAKSIPAALEAGGSVTVIRRWTKAKVRRMMDDGDIDEAAGETLLEGMSTKKNDPGRPDTGKENAAAAGIKTGAGSKYAQVYETWTKLKVNGEMRLCRAYYGGSDQVLGCKLNPYWCDEAPILSCPVKKIAGVFKGLSQVSRVIDTQIDANDAANEWADTAHFSAMPIVMTDPEKNPNVGTMILGLAAIWKTSPKDTQFAQFPDMTQQAMARIGAATNLIFQTLGVNPAMIPQSTGGKNKRNQAEIAAEQQVDLLTTADAVTTLEEGILTPLIQRFIAYDHQFRSDPVLVKQYGEMGMRAIMEEVPPQQYDHRYEYRWFGVEAARNAQQIQQQIAALNVLKGIPPQMYQGYRLNAVPVITQIVENAFGPRLAPLVFEDTKMQLSVQPETENMLLEQGFDAMVHPMDDDMAHIQSHMQAMQMTGGDPHGTFRAHIIRHQMQMQEKAQAEQKQLQGLPGSPGGAAPGVAGTPRPGAQPAMPRQLKGPEGGIPQDQMPRAGSVPMPRKM